MFWKSGWSATSMANCRFASSNFLAAVRQEALPARRSEIAPVRERLRPRLAVPHAAPVGARHIELARRGAANHGAPARPDAVAHVRIGRIVDPRLAQVADVLLILLDLLVAPRQVQRHFRHVVHAGVADVPYRDAGVTVWN